MFFPIGADAPLYHRPFATIGLIAANVVAFVFTWQGNGEGWLLHYGDGLHPTQWITSVFYHFGPMHLLGNMVFLWTFGLIVEGKIGWWRFLPLYLGLAAAECAIEQTIMLGYDGSPEAAVSGGASSAIYALMAISLIWAPRNEISVFYFFFFGIYWRTGTFEVSVLFFSLFFIGLDLLLATLTGFRIGTEVLHLLGALVGFPAGIWMVKAKLVDCEGWDVFSLLKKRTLVEEAIGPEALRLKPERPDPDQVTVRRPSAKRRARQIREAAEAGNFLGAASFYRELHAAGRQAVVDEQLLRVLIEGTRKEKDWPLLIRMLEDYIARFPENDTNARLMLAGLLVREQQRPRSTLRVLDGIGKDELSPSQREYVETVRTAAESMIESGVMELAVDESPDA